ncbi:hypothetical protein Glove_108g12 [Diversispora epigaea]|uniref:Helicase ATP-binding domain-containing protein n=1 Tax=Diversispora epigaea TaxID=1348612 RepID=A0A397JD47_9GLOM|nr:hypothetical protein Glove_108g12 [Diversispora epigaea]
MSNSFTLRNDASQTDPEYCYVIALMNAKLSNPYDNQIFINFYEASLTLILRRFNRSPFQHLLCTSELEDIVIEMMPLFSLDTPDYRVDMFRCIFEHQLRHCCNCVLTYHKKIRFFIQRWKQIYDPSSVDLYSNHLEIVYVTRIQNGLVELKQKLLRENTLDPSQLLGIVNFPLNTDNSTALFEILVYPKALQHGTVNKLFVEILLILLQRENLPRPTNRFLPGVFIVSLHENLEIQNWAWSTLQNINSSLNFNEMMEGDFESVIQSVLSFIVEFFRQTGAFYTQYPFTNNHALIWKGIEMMLSKMGEDVISEYFITKQPSIIIACNNYLSKPTELGFVEMINCLTIILDKLKEKFWRLISSQITYFIQRIFDAFFFITKASPITPLFCQSLILALNTLRNSYPKKQSTLIEQNVGVIHDEFIWLIILRENVSTVCEIYCFIGKMDHVDSLSKLDYQLRFSVWRNIFKYTSENILDHLELRSHTIVSFIECFNKIALMDEVSDLNNRGTNQNNNVALLSAFNLSISNIKCITLKFLEKLQMMNTQKLKTLLPVHIASFSIIHLLASPDSNIMASGLLFLKKLYFSNSYYEMIKENTEATILGLISVTTSFIQWTDVGCDTLKLANNIKTLLCEFIPLIFGEKCIFKDKPYFQNFKILTMQFWDILWVTYYKTFQLCKKWDRFGIITRHQEIKILLSEYLKIATITLMSHENHALEFSDSLYDLQMRYFSLLCVMLDSNDKDLLNIAAQESTKVLEFLNIHNLVIETKLYVKLENFSNIEENNELNEKELKEFTQALSKHTPKFPGIKSFESFELLDEELLGPDCDTPRSLGRLESDISKGSSVEMPVDCEQFENNSSKTAFPNYVEIVQSSSVNLPEDIDKEIMEDNPSPSISNNILDSFKKKIAEKQTFELENSAQVEKVDNSSKDRQVNIPKTFQISNEKAISISTKNSSKIQTNTSQKPNPNMSINERKYSPKIINSIELDNQVINIDNTGVGNVKKTTQNNNNNNNNNNDNNNNNNSNSRNNNNKSNNNSSNNNNKSNSDSNRNNNLDSQQKRRINRLQMPEILSRQITSLYKQILSWDFNNTNSSFPPNISVNDYKKFPNVFNSVQEYFNTFEKHLFLECWQHLINSKEEIDEINKLEFKLFSTIMVDDFVEVQLISRKIDLPFKKFAENDLIHVTQIVSDQTYSPKDFLAIITRITFENNNKARMKLKCYFRNNQNHVKSCLRVDSEWNVVRLFSLTPIAREDGALTSLPSLTSKDFILKPKENESIITFNNDDLLQYQNIYEVNSSQAYAILRIVNSESSFSLIQGSPGTGKSRTIIGLISAILNRNPKGKILVCAPSNSAVDELVKKLENFNVVRIGSSDSVCNNVKHKTLDYLAEKILMNNSISSARQEVLLNANVICSTLVGSGHEVLNIFKEFDYVIIDEAARATELSTLIPLKFNPKRCILVGDSNQLPLTVISHVATRYLYEQSLFARIKNNFKNQNSIILLDTQYRMHPLISEFPRSHFYNNLLKDSQEISTDSFRKWHSNILFPPYRFYNISQNKMEKYSIYNPIEARIIASAYKRLNLDFPDIKDWDSRVGVLTPYKRQKKELEREFKKVYDSLPFEMKIPEINTVDGFQGREKEIILFSCVSASEDQNIGFLRDIRRMNIALTRAKRSLWIFGSQESLIHNKVWESLINDAKARGVYTNISEEFFSNNILNVDNNASKEHYNNKQSSTRLSKIDVRDQDRKDIYSNKSKSSHRSDSLDHHNKRDRIRSRERSRNSTELYDEPLDHPYYSRRKYHKLDLTPLLRREISPSRDLSPGPPPLGRRRKYHRLDYTPLLNREISPSRDLSPSPPPPGRRRKYHRLDYTPLLNREISPSRDLSPSPPSPGRRRKYHRLDYTPLLNREISPSRDLSPSPPPSGRQQKYHRLDYTPLLNREISPSRDLSPSTQKRPEPDLSPVGESIFSSRVRTTARIDLPRDLSPIPKEERYHRPSRSQRRSRSPIKYVPEEKHKEFFRSNSREFRRSRSTGREPRSRSHSRYNDYSELHYPP